MSDNQVIAILERDNLRQGERGGVVNRVHLQFQRVKKNQNRISKIIKGEDGEQFGQKRKNHKVLLDLEIQKNLNLKEPLQILKLKWKRIEKIKGFDEQKVGDHLVLVIGFNRDQNKGSDEPKRPDVLAVLAYDKDNETREIDLKDLNYPQGLNDYENYREANAGQSFVEKRIENHRALNEYYKDKGYISNNQIVTFDKNYKQLKYIKQNLFCKNQLTCFIELNKYVMNEQRMKNLSESIEAKIGQAFG